MTARRLMPVAPAVLAVLAVFLLTGSGPPDKPAKDADVQKQLDEMKAAFNKLADDNKELADQLSHLSKTSPPVGSVQAFAADWPPRKVDGTAWTELETGWLLCDGRKLADVQAKLHEDLEKEKKRVPEDGILADLRAVLPRLAGDKAAEALPDYRGHFLRGTDNGANVDPEATQRKGGDRAGSIQGWATKAPIKPFLVNTVEDHIHDAGDGYNGVMRSIDADGKKRAHTIKEGDYTPGEADLLYTRKMAGAGKHTHTVTDGDKETRPVNVAVNYIIKFL